MSSSITVYILDSDKSIQNAMARIMRASRLRAVCVSSVEELLVQELPDHDAVIIADVNTARRFAETLPHQLHGQNRSLPVIYITDYDTEWIRNEAKRVGAVGYFRKPVDEQALVDAIEFAVRRTTAEAVF
jgi:FixJ family two-component response regulator